MFIYLITNLVNGKYYVGKTEQPPLRRWSAHKADSLKRPERAPLLYRAMRKYGTDSFRFDVIAAATTVEQLNALEQLWICVLRSADPTVGYNLTLGGTGGVPNTATREKLRAPKSAEHRKHLSESKVGNTDVSSMVTAVARAKAWATRRRNTSLTRGVSDSTRAAMSLAARNRARLNPKHLVAARAARRAQVRGPHGEFISSAPRKETQNGMA